MADEEQDTQSTEKDPKPNPFLDNLRDNQLEQARGALVKTLCENTEKTIGFILDALEEEPDGEYFMLEAFKGLTITDLVKAAAPAVLPDLIAAGSDAVPTPTRKPSAPAASASEGDDEEEDDLVDDNEFDDEDDAETTPAPKKKKTKKGKKGKKGKAKKDKKAKKDGEESSKKSKGKKKKKKLASGGDDPGEKDILRWLKANAKGKANAKTSAEMRDDIGGDAKAVKAHLDNLFAQKKVKKTGMARGTKYYT